MNKDLTWSERRLVAQFRKSFVRQCKSIGKPARLAEVVARTSESIWQADQIDHPDKQTRLHHLMACIVLAAEQVLSEEVPAQQEHSFIQGVNRCFYNSYFREAAKPHLTAVFCAFDKVWIEAIKPEKDRVRFVRSSTLAAGDDQCRFEFHRTN